MKKRKTKSFIILLKESIINKLSKILNHEGNIGKKKFLRTEIIILSFFAFEIKYLFFSNRVICMF